VLYAVVEAGERVCGVERRLDARSTGWEERIGLFNKQARIYRLLIRLGSSQQCDANNINPITPETSYIVIDKIEFNDLVPVLSFTPNTAPCM
jgi:hypothetical protein